MNPTIGIGNFARRQTKESQWAHFEETEENLVLMTQVNFDQARDGNRDGIKLVPVPAQHFFSSLTKIDESTQLEVTFGSRREHEEKHISVNAIGQKVPAKSVEIVIYRADVLEENNERETEADWEIVSINASPTPDPVPMRPLTMARNSLEKEGGTKTDYTPQEWAESVWFWSQYTNVRNPEEYQKI